MNIDDALLTRRLLHSLKSSIGKTHDQLAIDCKCGNRRMTSLLFCLEKAGLVMTHDSGHVTLSSDLAGLVYWHADHLRFEDKQTGPAFDGAWKAMIDAVKDHSEAGSEFAASVLQDIFGSYAIFGSKK